MNGGHYGSNGGRQQRKRPRDNEDEHYRRPRPMYNYLDKLRRDLVNLADPGNVDPVSDIRYVVRNLANEFQNSENQDKILELLLECILQFSIKTSQYAALVASTAAQNQEFGTRFFASLTSSLTQAFASHTWRNAKLLLRLLAALDTLLVQERTTAFTIVKQIASQIASSGLSQREPFADHLCALVMLTLPYLSVVKGQSDQNLPKSVATLLEQLESYMTVRKGNSSDLCITSVSATGDPWQHESLDVLFSQSKKLASSGYHVHFLSNIVSEVLSAETKSPQFAISEIVLPERRKDILSLTKLLHFLPIFNEEAVATVPTKDDLASSLFRDIIIDVLDLFVANRKDSARYLIDMESYLAPSLFVLRGTPPDKIPVEGPTWKAEDVVVEGIFEQLFALPTSTQKAVYYHSVLMELCKLVPQAIAPTFGRAIRALYNRLSLLEAEVVYRFWDWFSHHLSNFAYTWKWQLWAEDLNQPRMHPKIVFIHETIWKEAELSYNDRIKTTLPEEYHQIISDKIADPILTYGTPGHPLSQPAADLLNILSTEHEEGQINSLLESVTQKATENKLDQDTEAVALLCQCVLQSGHQSFSHALNTIEHNLTLLQAQCNRSVATRRRTVAAVMEFWAGRPLVASTLLQKFLNYRLISPVSILEYLLLDAAPLITSTSACWELIRTTIDKVCARVTQVRDRLQSMTSKNHANGQNIEPDAELARVQATWSEVQLEQKEVFVFALRTFSQKLAVLQDESEEQKWVKYWLSGLFGMVLRRYKDEITRLRGEILTNCPEVETWLQ